MTKDLMRKARERYLSAYPLRVTEVPAVTVDGTSAGSMTIPNIGDMQIVGCKLGMEYLAICHDDDAVEEWIQIVLGIAKEPDLVGILFANVFRGFNTVLGSLTDRPGLREHLQRQAVEAWTRDFSGDSA